MTLDYFYGQAGELFSFYRIPKALFQEPRFQSLSTDAKTLYGILLDRMSLSVKNGWLDEQNRVFILFTIEDVKRALCCADNKATKLLRELEKFGLIERKRRGLGKPSLVYVKNFSAESSFSGNIYLDIANKPDRRVWLVCCSTEWGVEEKCSCVSSSSPIVSHAGGGTAGVQLVGDLVGAVIESIVIHALVDAHAPQDDAGVIAVLQDPLL